MEYRNGSHLSQGSVDARIARLSARQYGTFSRVQAMDAGATPRIIQRRLAIGRWERLYPGVYRTVGTPSSWRQALFSACLAGAGVASYLGAGGLWVLPGCDRGAVEISVSRERRVRLRGVVVHHVSDLPSVDVVMVDAIPVTTATRTLIDLAGIVSDETLEEALDDALMRRLTTVSRMAWRAETLKSRPGIGVVRELIAARARSGPVPKSVLETRFLRLVKRSRLPAPERQHRVRDRGRVLGVVDFAYPERKLAIETDGYRWHGSRARWERDLARGNDLMGAGWRVIRVTDSDLTRRPQEVAAMIAGALANGR